MTMNIVVEGPDGCGKSTLIEHMMIEYPTLKVRPRSWLHDGHRGPIKDLYRWTIQDMATWGMESTPRLYDRYPFVSEYIYGPLIRGEVDSRFFGPEAIDWLQDFYTRSLLILCIPPRATMMGNLSKSTHMAGVVLSSQAIWASYSALYAQRFASTRDIHRPFHYDYTDPKAFDRLCRMRLDTMGIPRRTK